MHQIDGLIRARTKGIIDLRTARGLVPHMIDLMSRRQTYAARAARLAGRLGLASFSRPSPMPPALPDFSLIDGEHLAGAATSTARSRRPSRLPSEPAAQDMAPYAREAIRTATRSGTGWKDTSRPPSGRSPPS